MKTVHKGLDSINSSLGGEAISSPRAPVSDPALQTVTRGYFSVMEAQGLLAPVGGLCEGNGGMFQRVSTSSPSGDISFENSVRRDPSPQEGMSMLRVTFNSGIGLPIGGSGFFVRNSGNQLIVESARHCANYDFTSACRNGQISVTTEFWELLR